jgi:Family of unknown function (DUF6328)
LVTDDRPDETEAERADRNFVDLLQELRVVQTGVQILFAFQLTLPLQARFASLDAFQRGMFVISLLLTSAATVCLIAPVAYHRALFQRRMKHELVLVAGRFAVLGLGFLALAVTTAVHLVLDQVAGRAFATGAAALLATALLLTWAVLPLALRHRQPVTPALPSSQGHPGGTENGSD